MFSSKLLPFLASCVLFAIGRSIPCVAVKLDKSSYEGFRNDGVATLTWKNDVLDRTNLEREDMLQARGILDGVKNKVKQAEQKADKEYKDKAKGGKRYGQLRQGQEKNLDEINKSFVSSGDYDDEDDYPDLNERLESYKKQFMEFDENDSGDIDIMELKRMMEKLGQAKTHLELKKMIAEVDTTNSGTISYPEFLTMMLGKKSSVLKLILMFEEKKKEKSKPTGVAPKRDLASLP